ncbi:MAG TPA: GH25 family lysozyme [Beijerinckiaceae bacterium]|nr:GH25 family lysozyme [Beijerinckiaceae bacterium]
MVFARCVAALALITLAGCASELDSYDSYPAPRKYPIHGIDVSKYQGNINWAAVRRARVKFAWIKATEGGDYVDSNFQRNWFAAKAAGVPRGAYHFVYWCRPWQQEIAWFEANVPVDPDALPPVLDVEATPDSKTCKRHLVRAQVIREMSAMLAELQRHYGKRPIIYTTVDFYRAILQPNVFSNYAIWVRSTKYRPAVEYGNRKWRFWQYQSDGYVPGVPGKVDRNAFYGDAAQWRAFLRRSGSNPRSGRPLETMASAPWSGGSW